MAIPSLFNTYIDETYQRLVQTTGSGAEFADGLGNPITFGQTPTGSLLTTASAAGNTITFTKGDGSTFPVTVSGGSGTPGDGDQAIQFNSASVFSGSAKLKYDYVNSNIILTGSLLVTQSHISTVDYVDFSPNKYDTVTPGIVPSHVEGRLFYDTGSQTLCMYNNELDVTLNIGQESWLRARNQTGVTITNGSVVKILGAVGSRPSIVLAQSTDQVQVFGIDNDIIGMATHDIEQGTDGFITTFGLVNGVDTAAFSAGDLLWVSQSAGQYTNIPPSAPYDKTFVGVVTRANKNNGTIFITPQQPLHFHDISSVSQSGNYTQGDIWMFKQSGSSGVWTNTKTLSGSYTLSGSLTTNDGVSVQTLTASIVSASQITGSLFGTASWARNAITSSYVTGSIFTNANSAASASYSVTSSYAVSASFATSASRAISASYAPTLPGGLDTQIQYNNSNILAGDSAFTYNYTQQSLQQGNNVATSGSYSHAEGISTIAYGVGSHAEGSGSWTGQLGYLTVGISYNFIANRTDITLNSVYGDVTGDIDNAVRLIFDDSSYNNIFGRILTIPSGLSSWNGTNTIVTVPGDYSTTATAIIGILNNRAPINADKIIPGHYAHAEGKESAAVGYGSHAAGTGSIAYGDLSYAGGEGVIAIAQGQTVLGNYNMYTNPGAYVNSFVVGKGMSNSTRDDIFRVSPVSDTVYVSASTVQFAGLPDTAQTNVLTYDPANGQVYYTASSAVGGSSTSTFPFTGSAIITGSLTVTGSIRATQGITGSLQGTASWATNAVTSFTPISTTGSTIYSTSPATSNISSTSGVFLGSSAGNGAINADYSIFLGLQTGQGATSANESVFIGPLAGQSAARANGSVFLGSGAGQNAVSASYSTLIGYYAGSASTSSLSIGTNNIILGNNITLPSNTRNSINIGAIIFATGSYSLLGAGNLFSGSVMGRVGINLSNPQYNFDVSGSGNYTNGLTVSGSFTVVTGSSVEFQVSNTGVKIGNVSTDSHSVTGSVNITGSLIITGSDSNQTYLQIGFPNRPLLIVSGSSRVGINTFTPSYGLDVAGSGNFSQGLTITGSSSAIEPLRISNGTTSLLFVSSSGNVGIGTTTPTANLQVNGNIIATSFTGSLQGTASWANNATTASYILQAVSSSFATLAQTSNTASFVTASNVVGTVTSASYALTSSYAANGGVTQIIAGTNITISPSNGLGAVTINSSGGAGGAGANITASFTNQSTWTFTHALNNRGVVVQTYDTSWNQIIPENITLTDANTATITFPTLESGFAIATLGGTTSIVNASSSISASFASTASFVNTLNQSVNITGDVTASIFAATNNGNGTNFKVGDDAWIGDINTADTLGVRGQQSATRGYIRFGSGSSNPTLGSGGTSTLELTGSLSLASGSVTLVTGSITMPNRPAFRVVGSNSTNINSVTTITSTNGITIDYNQGGHYNNTTGIFTAPVAGLYQVFFNARVGGNNSQMQAILYKNSNVVQLMWEAPGLAASTHFGVSGVVSLAANDNLRVTVTVGQIQFDGNDSWGATYIG